MHNAGMEQAFENAVLNATKAVESQIDDQIKKLDELGDDDLEAIRARRLAEMKKQAELRQEYIRKGHGHYGELSEHDFMKGEASKSQNIVVHFYRPTTQRCEIVDKHMQILAPKHVNARFVKLNVEKCGFLCQRLNITVIPSIAVFVKGVHADTIVGFDSLGGYDEFPTEVLEWRLGETGVIRYNGDLTGPVTKTRNSGILLMNTKKTIRGTADDSDDD